VVLLRTTSDPAALTKTVRDIIRAQHADLSLYHLRTMSQEMAAEVAVRSFLMQVAAAFGALALFLAILGTYGLLAYEVSLREKEIGIRLALGSSRQAIVQLLLGQESRWVLIGALAGVVGAIVTGYALRAQFYHARAASLPVLAASLALLILPSLVAIALPARRAAHLDPVHTLRSE
jgi:ABC-type antimicrobial peptide transport system permease subunit